MNEFETVVVGGGAAGFFSSANVLKGKTLLLEKTLKTMSKVRISGGGRCNVTHACFDPRELASRYPRGSKELLGVFSRFGPQDTIDWFQKRGVKLKTEEDGRMFPVTDSSETIIACLMKSVSDAGVELKLGASISEIRKEEDRFIIQTDKEQFQSRHLILATGSSPQGHQLAKNLGHTITPLVPSLFTFNVPLSPLLELSGISVPKATVSVVGTRLKETGPLLLTHFGFSGPAVLRLSAWGAIELHAMNYQAKIKIDWTGGIERETLKSILKKQKPQNVFTLDALVDLPKALSKKLYSTSKRIAELSNKEIEEILDTLTASEYALDGKTTYKSEFVTCGGVTRKEIDFKTMESRLCPGLYFAGEVIDIDGITGGFNFQNAWSTGFIAASSINNPR